MNIKNTVCKSTIGRKIWLSLYRFKMHTRRKACAKAILKASKNNPHIFYCGICESSNMGDMAQTYCTIKWLKKNYPEYQLLFCPTSVFMDKHCHLIDIMKKVIKKSDFIVFQSGYNTHDLGGNEDIMHQMVITAFPEIKMIMLPQTVYFQSEERKNQCSKIYDAHKNLLFFARDPVSEAYAKQMFPSLRVILFPDIVTSLIGTYDHSTSERKGVYLCRRKDVEQYYTEEDYSRIKSILSKFDDVEVSDTIIKASNKDIFNNLQGYVEDMIRHFSSFRIVVTDKFHGLIFSMIAGTPVIVIKTKDHKVTSGYEWFSRHYPSLVYYANTEDEIEHITTKILSNPSYEKPDDYFNREYYEKLCDVISCWEKENANM